jgi:hypothetical protein
MQSAECACGITNNFRILVSQCASQSRLNGFSMWSEINQGIHSAAPNVDALIAKEVHEQRNCGWTNPPDDFESHVMEIFIPTGE